MSSKVLDIETDGLKPSTIWCAVVGDEVHTTKGTFKFSQEDNYYAHNGIGFDYPVLHRLWDIPVDPQGPWPDNLRDTLVLSRLACPDRAGGHSLAAWGSRLGFPKGDHNDWSQYTPEMLSYCKQDVKVTTRVLEALARELDGFSEESIQLEHQVAWIIAQQERNGWLLDQRGCFDLLAELKERKNELEKEVHERFIPICKAVREIEPRYKKDGTLSSVGLKFLGDSWARLVGGPFTRVDFPDFNLGSRKQIAEYLIRFGWEPDNTTDKGNVIVDETTLEGVDIPEAQLIAEYLMIQKRIAQVQSWLDAVGEDGRVHGRVNPCGAVTTRMTHMDPNMAQVPASRKPYGRRCREVWCVPEGYKLVGCDAESLELVMLAHYMDDEGFIKAVSEGNKDDGTDPHTVNQRAAGLDTRDQAKTFIYAFLYGAGDAKIGSIVGGGTGAGRSLKSRFLKRTPALASLRERVEAAARRGFLKGLDGRHIAIRSPHAALNTLLQGGGAIVMKRALVILDHHIRIRGLEAKFVGNIHDEIQMEVLEKDAPTVKWLSEASIAAAGDFYNLRCPLRGSAIIGDTWYDTH